MLTLRARDTHLPETIDAAGDAAARAAAADATSPDERGPDRPRSERPTLSCVIPCWNESANLSLLLPQLADLFGTLASAWEVIVVDDGSTDGSVAMLGGWSRVPGFQVIELSRNFGKEAALTAGLEATRGDVVVMMDADLQHPPALIEKMIERWREGADVVYTVRENRDDESRFKRIGARWFYRLVNTADRFEMPAGAGDFRLMDRLAVNALLALPERNRFMKGLYAWIGFNAVALPYVPDDRAYGRSSYSKWRLMQLSLDGITAFTTWPLRAVSLSGFVLAVLGFLYGAYLTITYLTYGTNVSGWTTIVVCLLCFFGVQLISIGVLGEYIGRIFAEVKARPLYIVKRRHGRGLDARAE